VQVNSFVGAFHDAVILYALALNETLEAGLDATNGTEITRRMWNRTFQGHCTTAPPVVVGFRVGGGRNFRHREELGC